jgi:sensor histidine kinase YesM
MGKALKFFDKQFFKHWFIHALVLWLILVLLSTGQYVYTSYVNQGYFILFPDGTYLTGWQYFLNTDLQWIRLVPPFVIAFFLELNYKWIKQKRHERFISIVKNSLGSVLGILLFYLFVIFKEFDFTSILDDLVGVFFIFMLYNIAYFYIRSSIENQKKKAEKRYQKSQAELDVLKAQLNPHFFFNSLNSLYGTALQENAPKTLGLIEQLSSIMRYTMGKAQNAFTDVKNELDFIENYWALQEVRLPKKDTIRLSKQVFFDEKKAQIAPLLLIPFIENAFKYGISIDKACKIDLDLSIENQQLKMILSNIIQEDKTLEKGNSIGIENTKKRLELIYDNRYTLTQSQEANVYTVVLTIELT